MEFDHREGKYYFLRDFYSLITGKFFQFHAKNRTSDVMEDIVEIIYTGTGNRVPVDTCSKLTTVVLKELTP